MNPSWREVDAAVLAALGDFAGPGSARNGHAPAIGRPKPARAGAGADSVFAERLLSAEVAGRLAEGRSTLRVAAGTVVTPLAYDLLKRRGVAVRFVSGREAAAGGADRAGEWGFAIDATGGVVEPTRRAFLVDRRWAEVGRSPVEAARWVAEADGRGALVLVDEASVAAYRAGRVRGIRAATACDPEAAGRAVRHLGANLIVAEVAGRSVYLLRQIGERFRQGGAPAEPDDLGGEDGR